MPDGTAQLPDGQAVLSVDTRLLRLPQPTHPLRMGEPGECQVPIGHDFIAVRSYGKPSEEPHTEEKRRLNLIMSYISVLISLLLYIFFTVVWPSKNTTDPQNS